MLKARAIHLTLGDPLHVRWGVEGGGGGEETLDLEELKGAGAIGDGGNSAKLRQGELVANIQHLTRPRVLRQSLIAVVILQGHLDCRRGLNTNTLSVT
jgi:hypothetical protein